MTLVQRLPRPAVLLIVLGMLFLPFLTVSCSGPTGKSDIATFSGYDANLGAAPSTNLPTDLKGADKASPMNVDDDAPESVRYNNTFRLISGYVAVGVLVLGLVLLLFMPNSISRSVTGLATALFGLVGLIFNISFLSMTFEAAMSEAVKSQPPSDLDGLFGNVDFAHMFVASTSWGFWVTAITLVLFAAANGVRLRYPPSKPITQSTPYPLEPALNY